MAKKDKVSAAILDFTNVKEGGGSFNKRRVPAGDYRATVTKVVDAPAKSDGVMQWLFTFQTASGGTYPYYCKHQENQLWKIRNLLVAAGLEVPKKKVNVNPEKLVGREIGISLEDDEYDGKAQSTVASVFPASEVSSENELEAADEAEETPKKKEKKKGKKSKGDDDELESMPLSDV